VATAVSKTVAIMVNGRVNRLIESSRLAVDRDLQQRLLGVGRHSQAELEIDAEANDDVAAGSASPRPLSLAPRRIYISNPTLPTRWSQPTPIARIESSARTLSSGVLRLQEAARPRATRKRREAPDRRRARRRHAGYQGRGTQIHPRHRRRQRVTCAPRRRLDQWQASSCDVSAQEIALNHARGGGAVFGPDRGTSVAAMAEAFANWLRPKPTSSA